MTSDNVIMDGGLDNTEVDVNSVMDIIAESTDDVKVLNNNLIGYCFKSKHALNCPNLC